jgi:hypothetical protein
MNSITEEPATRRPDRGRTEVSDIVERLQSYWIDWDGQSLPDGAEPMDGLHCCTLREAATEISSLRSRVERLESTLENLACRTQTEGLLWWQIVARAALRDNGRAGE